MQKWRMPWFLFENFVDAATSYFLKIILFGCLAGTRIVVFRQIELDSRTDTQRRVGINLLHEYRPDRQSIATAAHLPSWSVRHIHTAQAMASREVLTTVAV